MIRDRFLLLLLLFFFFFFFFFFFLFLFLFLLFFFLFFFFLFCWWWRWRWLRLRLPLRLWLERRSSFCISSEKKQVSFIPTRPPTTYVNTRLADYTGDVHDPPHAKQNLVPSLPCCRTALCTCHRRFHCMSLV